jgi:hypothetical protein
MQMRSKAYLHFISLWRSFRDAIWRRHDYASAKASPFLIYVAVMLALLLTIMEIDAHRSLLESFGLLGSGYSIEPGFLSP